MITNAVLEQGIVRGIVTGQQVESLRALARDMAAAQVSEPEDDEKLRFITGFGDIFVTLGLGLFTGALAYLMKQVGDLAMWASLAVAAWLLAEFFTGRRRMALPSIALLVLFAVAIFFTVNHALVALSILASRPGVSGLLAAFGAGPMVVTALLTMALTALHYRRFRVPITVAAGVAALLIAIGASLYGLSPQLIETYNRPIIMALGLGVFALAMRFDLSDPARLTRRTDIAFWLHLLAAPLIVHPLISLFVEGNGLPQLSAAIAVLGVFLALGVVAVAIDRRAMLVSGLAYAGYAFASLIQHAGITDRTLPLTLLALGAFVLLLSAGWRPVRTTLLRLLPAHLAQRLPHPILSSS